MTGTGDVMTDDDFLDAFENAAISSDDWTHAAHVRMAWLYLRREASVDAAIAKACAGIPKLNAANDVAPSFYHETVTHAFMYVVHECIVSAPEIRDWEDFEKAFPELFDKAKPVLARYYTQDTLFSDAARTTFVAPDIRPFEDNSTRTTG